MKQILFLAFIFSVFFLISCNKSNDPNPNSGNNAPGDFTVTITNLSNSSATINWTSPTDQDGDEVTYEVILNLGTIAINFPGNSISLEDLSGGFEYSGAVVANDGNGGLTQKDFGFQTYSVDTSRFRVGEGNCVGGVDCLKSIELVDCIWQEEGGNTKCYEITYYSNPIADDGPFCPENENQTGGLGNYDGDGIANGGVENGDPVGWSRLDGALFQAMENDGFDIIDAQGNIRIQSNVGAPPPNLSGNPPSFCLEPTPDDQLELSFQIPVWPQYLTNADGIESVEFIGVSLDGIPINGAPPSVISNSGNIPALDPCGVHHDPAGYLHWHFIAENMNDVLEDQGLYEVGVFECSNITQSESALIGYARDGFPIYSSGGDTESNEVLDNCNGHFAKTVEHPEGIYHYHATTDAPNVPICIRGRQSTRSFDNPQ